MYKAYNGAGSRETPTHIADIMEEVGFKLSQEGWTLRSGGADGADNAFQAGASNSFSEVIPEIYLPWYGFNSLYTQPCLMFPSSYKNWTQAQQIAKEIHPNWEACSDGAKSLHSRNIYQVLGQDLDSPSKFLICWGKEDRQGDVLGGTRTAWMLAKKNNIPCFNLNRKEHLERIQTWLRGTRRI